MGMFDTINVKKNLIDNVLKEHNFKNFEEYNNYERDYYNFQTKNLDNCLQEYYLEEDGTFLLGVQEYEIAKITEKNKFPFMQPVGEVKKQPTTINSYIDFYDGYNTDHEYIWVTFSAHIEDGKLVKDITVKNIERTNLAEERCRNHKATLYWNAVKSTWQWKLTCLIDTIRFKFNSLFVHPITKTLDKVQKALIEKAKVRIDEHNEDLS